MRLRVRVSPAAPHRDLTKPEILTLVGCCSDPEIKDAILIAAYTGLRLGELMRLKRNDIQGGIIRVDSNTKTGVPRSVPIVPLIKKALKRVPFTYPKRKIQEKFMQARKLSKMGHVHFHDLRHTTAGSGPDPYPQTPSIPAPAHSC